MSAWLHRLDRWLQNQHDISRQKDIISCLVATGFTLPLNLIFFVMPLIAKLQPQWAAIYNWQAVPYVQALLLGVCLVQFAIILYSWNHRSSTEEHFQLSVITVAVLFLGLFTLCCGYEYRDSPLMMLCLSLLVLVRALFQKRIFIPTISIFALIYVLYEIGFWTGAIPTAILLNAPIYVGEQLQPWWEFWLRVIYVLVTVPTALLFFVMGYFMIREKQQLEHLVATDSLTGLANRSRFMKSLEFESKRQQRKHKKLCVLMCDVDHFKQVNDTWGHPAGDQVLEGVGRVMQKCVRANTDLVARVGGEEFVVLLPDMALMQAKLVAESIRKSVEEQVFESSGQSFQVSLSIGVAQIENGDGDTGIKVADKLLYCAKAIGRNCVVVQRPYLMSALNMESV